MARPLSQFGKCSTTIVKLHTQQNMKIMKQNSLSWIMRWCIAELFPLKLSCVGKPSVWFSKFTGNIIVTMLVSYAYVWILLNIRVSSIPRKALLFFLFYFFMHFLLRVCRTAVFLFIAVQLSSLPMWPVEVAWSYLFTASVVKYNYIYLSVCLGFRA